MYHLRNSNQCILVIRKRHIRNEVAVIVILMYQPVATSIPNLANPRLDTPCIITKKKA